jgi:hypothetical protein
MKDVMPRLATFTILFVFAMLLICTMHCRDMFSTRVYGLYGG